jgi:putative flippase GtrA
MDAEAAEPQVTDDVLKSVIPRTLYDMRVRRTPLAGVTSGVDSRRQFVEKVLRYAAGSVVATLCSEVTFLLLYGPLGASPAVSSALGWLAGAVPNYWLNRSWTWQRRGRPSMWGEIVPYVTIVLVTLLLAVAATSLVDSALTGARVAGGLRVVLVGGTFLGVYGVVFLLRFFLLDRLFRRAAAASAPGSVGAVSAKEPV